MFKFIKKYFGFYYLLFFASYISIYLSSGLTPFINLAILGVSYYLIIKRQRFDVVIVLILYSRCMNGFIIPHHKTAYLIINLFTNVVPLLIYISGLLIRKKVYLNRDMFTSKYRYGILFFIFLSLSFWLNYSTAFDLVTKRYLPFLFFLVFLVFNRPNDFNSYGLIRFFRSAFLASVILYFFSHYLEITRMIIESDSVFSVASLPNSYSLVYMSYTRNMGFFWDHRILAIFSYLFLLMSIIYKPKYYQLDVLLSFIIVVTSTSRGGMVTYALILFVYLFQVYRYKLVLMISVLAISGIIAIIFAGVFLPPSALYFLQSFSPNSQYNAISQREFFSNYALNAFSYHPVFGNGVGFLSSHSIDRHLIVDGVTVPAVGDAYWYILLAEMGVVGFLLYLFFLFEVFYSNKLLSIALLIGFSLQLLGTDIPDMRFYYFAILVTVYMINFKFKKTTSLKLKHA